MELLEVLTTSQNSNCTCGCYYGNCFVPTTADTIASMRPLLLSLERLRLLEQSMIMMRLNCSHDHSCLATEGSPAVFEFSLSNPSAIAVDYTFTFTNGTAGVLITLPLRKQ
jgi:hypothetical protein